MNPTNLATLRIKFIGLLTRIRVYYYRILGLQIGNGVRLGKIHCEWPGNVQIGNYCDIQNNVIFWIKNPFLKSNVILIGKNVFIGNNCEFNCSNYISVGDNCLIASNTTFVDINHSIDKEFLINSQPIKSKPIIIEEDVWIGSGSIILKGVRIGKGSVIGAGSLVNRSVPDYEIWAGLPAKKIGERN
ncbi:acyltransferase [Cyclobacterium jeungdonense]|uniref:DapH/DapD/GlmU-related protein n=1 Tax=Cyclobacterium jeungdonense TaxID=708087 RepID=A0ABT8C9V5_9BACT|nr:acyltransferase [Cyclobacterium jeungdonense]MDN3688872.1 DapH/DapD/GlmU-related protein [Cyclobacterium jeungdonense]